MRLVLIFLALSATSAFGDEFVCKLPNGKKLIQDSPCPAGTTTTYANTAPPESPERTAERFRRRSALAEEARIESRKKSAEIAALLRYDQQQKLQLQRQRTQESEAESAVPQQDIMDQIHGAFRPTPMVPLASSLPPPQKLQPSTTTSCDPSGCWDNVGNRYNRAAGGFFRDDGKFCQKVGSGVQCP